MKPILIILIVVFAPMSGLGQDYIRSLSFQELIS